MKADQQATYHPTFFFFFSFFGRLGFRVAFTIHNFFFPHERWRLSPVFALITNRES